MVKVKYDFEKKKWIVLPNFSKEGFYLDGYLYGNLLLYKKMVSKNNDLGFVIFGREGRGKTVLLMTILKFLDPTYDLSRCHMTGTKFLKGIIKEKEKLISHGLDEAQEFNSRSAMNAWNKKCIEVVSKIRAKQLYWGIAIPAFHELERYLAIHRTSFAIEVYDVKGSRGYFKFWNWQKKKMLYFKGKKFYDTSVVTPNFRGCFTLKAFPFDMKEYDKKKMDAIDEISLGDRKVHPKVLLQRDVLINCLIKKYGVISAKDLSKYLKSQECGMSTSNIGEILRKVASDS